MEGCRRQNVKGEQKNNARGIEERDTNTWLDKKWNECHYIYARDEKSTVWYSHIGVRFVDSFYSTLAVYLIRRLFNDSLPLVLSDRLRLFCPHTRSRHLSPHCILVRGGREKNLYLYTNFRVHILPVIFKLHLHWKFIEAPLPKISCSQPIPECSQPIPVHRRETAHFFHFFLFRELRSQRKFERRKYLIDKRW